MQSNFHISCTGKSHVQYSGKLSQTFIIFSPTITHFCWIDKHIAFHKCEGPQWLSWPRDTWPPMLCVKNNHFYLRRYSSSHLTTRLAKIPRFVWVEAGRPVIPWRTNSSQQELLFTDSWSSGIVRWQLIDEVAIVDCEDLGAGTDMIFISARRPMHSTPLEVSCACMHVTGSISHVLSSPQNEVKNLNPLACIKHILKLYRYQLHLCTPKRAGFRNILRCLYRSDQYDPQEKSQTTAQMCLWIVTWRVCLD